MRIYNQYISPLRQTAKQRASSELAEYKWNRVNPLVDKKRDLTAKMNCFSQNIMMNRYMMKTHNFNNLNTIRDYASSIHEVTNRVAA